MFAHDATAIGRAYTDGQEVSAFHRSFVMMNAQSDSYPSLSDSIQNVVVRTELVAALRVLTQLRLSLKFNAERRHFIDFARRQ